jgi:tetratricopeptide (TPR) repeat protein
MSYLLNSFCVALVFAFSHAAALAQVNTPAPKSRGACFEAGELVQKAAVETEVKTRESLYRDAIKLCSSLPEAHYNLGVFLKSQNRPEEALSAFQAAAQVRQEELFDLAIGTTLRDLNRFEEATRVLLRIVDESEASSTPSALVVRALQVLSSLYEAQDVRPKALEALLRAQALDPGNFVTWFNLAVLYERSGQLDAARMAYERAVRIEPRNAEPQLYLARVLRDLEEPDLSRRALERAGELAPGDARVQLAMGALFDSEGDPERAELAIKRALDTDPKNVSAWVNLALVQLDASRPQDALESAREALSLSSDDARALGVSGWALLELGKIDDGALNFERALSLAPGSYPALISLAELRVRQGRIEEAEKLRSEALASSGDADQGVASLSSRSPWQVWR